MNRDYDYHKLCRSVAGKWYYILFALIIFTFCAYLFNLLAIPLYRATASIKLEDKKSELTELVTIKNVYDRSSKSETEKFILSSRHVLTKAINAMDYKVSYYKDSLYSQVNIYPVQPILIEIYQIPDDQTFSTLFSIKKVNPDQFLLSCKINDSTYNKRFSYGETIQLQGFSFKIIKSLQQEEEQKKIFYFRINALSELLTSVSKSLKIDDNLNTNILNLSFTDQNRYYAKDMLNAILNAYQKYDLDQRSISMKQISFYIDTLLEKMSPVLQKSGVEMQNFKTGHQMLDISSNAEALIKQLTDLETEKHQVELRNLLTRHLKKVLDTDPGLNTLNFNIQNSYDPQLTSLLNKYNLLIDKKTEALVHYPPASAYMLRLDSQIAEIKLEVMSNIENQAYKDEELIAYLKNQISFAKQEIQSAPKLERNYINLQSEFNINQKVYNYLSEKKLESEIATAAVIPNAQLIDEASVANKPVYPVKMEIYKDFALVGILLGILSIFIAQKLDPHLYEVALIEESTSVPIIGAIHRQSAHKNNDNISVLEMPRSLFAESVRAMRANLQQLISDAQGKIICITSAVAGEGKSFTSVNLAGALCLIEKKVIIVATDLRKSELHKTFGADNQIGLSSYLSGKGSIEHICLKTKFNNLDLIPAGPLPANPAELLQSERMLGLVSRLKQSYDFVILDTAPVGLVADSIPLLSLSDFNLFVLRYGVSSVASISLPEKLQKKFNLNHMAIVLNAFKQGHTPKGYYSLSTDKQSYSNYDKVASN